MTEKILYGCSFVPHMTLEAAGFEMISFYDIDHGLRGGQKLCGNLCSFVRICSQVDFSQFSGIILTNCCNSIQRLYDYILCHHPDIFAYLLEIPRNENRCDRYQDLFDAMQIHFGREVRMPAAIVSTEKKPAGTYIQVVSSALSRKYVQEMEKLFHKFCLQIDTCASDCRGDRLLLNWQAAVSCPRRADFCDWFETAVQTALGVIYIVSQRCDHIMFPLPEIRAMCRRQGRRFLCLEEEYTDRISETSKIRYEAFLECL